MKDTNPMVVITEFMDEKAVEKILKKFPTEYDPTLFRSTKKLKTKLKSAKALIVRNQTQVNSSLLDNAPNLKLVARLGVGLDNINLTECETRNIVVQPATGANSISVAEYVISAILILTRRVFDSTDKVIDGKWPRLELIGNEVQGKILGLIGFGEITQQVAIRAKALGMKITAHDPYVDSLNPIWKQAKNVTFDELISNSDVISLHIPLTDQTKFLIGQSSLAKMKNTTIMINSARGGIIDENALKNALMNQKLGGAALDVFEQEPISESNGKNFNNIPNLLLTPHIAGVTHESNLRVSNMIADKVIEFLTMC